MFDANNMYSNSVEYSLVQNNKWKYTFTVIADAEWINAEDRTFPVTIDPTIGTEQNYIIDYTYNESNTETTLKVGNGNKAYIELSSLPALPQDAYVTYASLNLYALTAGSNYVGAYERETTKLEDYNLITTNNDSYSWDISRILYNWYENGTTNRKIRLDRMEFHHRL